MKVTCPYCKKSVLVNFNGGQETETAEKAKAKFEHKPTVDLEKLGGNGRGQLVQVRRWFERNRTYPLHAGDNTIGRRDNAMPSMIQVDDSTMSRQSACIRMIVSEKTVDYILCMKKSKNPAYRNGKEIKEGEEHYLRFGDEIRLGSTIFRFERIKK